jgi:hypothetical protein
VKTEGSDQLAPAVRAFLSFRKQGEQGAKAVVESELYFSNPRRLKKPRGFFFLPGIFSIYKI